jgi:hypothetical protein
MITLSTKVDVMGISGATVSNFMINCTDEAYQKWWPGTHLEFHTIKRYPDNLGNLVYFDEYVGSRRLKFKGIVISYVPGKEMVWQMKKAIKLPAFLKLLFEDTDKGVRIFHSLCAGFDGAGKILDPFLNLLLSQEFKKQLDEHAHIEFNKLGEILA